MADKTPDHSPVDWEDADAVLDVDEVELIFDLPAPRPRLPKDFAERLIAHRVMPVTDLYNLPPLEWFIDGLVPEVARTMICGAGGSFKTFLVLDWMLCAATGELWHGHWICPGRVLYIAAEGARGMAKRIDAWLHAHRRDREWLNDFKNEISFMTVPINLFKGEHLEIWQGLVDVMQIEYIVIDTLHLSTAGADENSSQDMGRALEFATKIAGERKLFFVHHMTKDGHNFRGSGSLRDDVDVMLNLAPVPSQKLVAQLTADKVRDAERFSPINLEFAVTGDDEGKSLYIKDVVTGQELAARRNITAVDKCKDAIVEHGLDINVGQKKISEWLKDMDLGYGWGPPTVGKALKELRGAAQEIADMNRSD